jgi:lipopolysaccharide transport system permease protein
MLDALVLPAAQRPLVGALASRELASRYRSSGLGWLWPWLTPILVLGVFTFVFSTVLEVRFPSSGGAPTHPAILLFSGLCLASFLGETLARSPQTVTSQPNYVKKIVFPLEALTLVDVRVALVHLVASMAFLLVVTSVSSGATLSWLAIPMVILPLVAMATGLGWWLAALGVYFRDIAHLLPPLVTALTFLSPILYPRSAVPENVRDWLLLNPLTVPVEQLRGALLGGLWPQWDVLAVYSAVAAIVYWSGLAVFRRLKKGFADVL